MHTEGEVGGIDLTASPHAAPIPLHSSRSEYRDGGTTQAHGGVRYLRTQPHNHELITYLYKKMSTHERSKYGARSRSKYPIHRVKTVHSRAVKIRNSLGSKTHCARSRHTGRQVPFVEAGEEDDGGADPPHEEPRYLEHDVISAVQ